MRYRVFGLVLDSDGPLPEVAACTADHLRPDVRFRVLRASEEDGPGDWFMTWTAPGGAAWMRAARTATGFRIRFPGLADFGVDASGSEIGCVPRRGVPPRTVRHLLLNHVVPLVLNLRGVEAVHASAVATPRGAVAFIGPSGAGKSTLAARFHLGGHPAVADDCLPLVETPEGIGIVPAYPGLRLWADAAEALFPGDGATEPVADYSAKRRVGLPCAPETTAETLPLARVFVIRPTGARARVTALAPRDALVELIRAAFRFVVDDRAMLARQLRVLSRVAAEVPARRILLPRGLDAAGPARRAALADLETEKGLRAAGAEGREPRVVVGSV